MTEENEEVTITLDKDVLVSTFSIRRMAEEQADVYNIGNAEFLDAIAQELDNKDTR